MKLEEHGDATEEDVLISLKRAINRYSTLQAHDGHWPGDYAGPLFLLPSLVLSVSHFFFPVKNNNLLNVYYHTSMYSELKLTIRYLHLFRL
jgi:hypothetical protein